MKCPTCGHMSDKVVDSRERSEGDLIRRRRECLVCQTRFTTYEQIENVTPAVIKKNGQREQYDKRKIASGIKRACEKRPVSMETIEQVVDRIEKSVLKSGDPEISSHAIGEEVMHCLLETDSVAYVRFASVYREFKDVSQFMDELETLLAERKNV